MRVIIKDANAAKNFGPVPTEHENVVRQAVYCVLLRFKRVLVHITRYVVCTHGCLLNIKLEKQTPRPIDSVSAKAVACEKQHT